MTRPLPRPRFYVYALCGPTGDAFYYGKGCGDRITHHERDARAGLPGAKCDAIRAIWDAGGMVRRAILLRTDDEAAAYQLEHQLITAAAARGSVTNVNLYPSTSRAPTTRSSPPMTPEELEEALAIIGWTAPELARRVQRHRSFIHKIRDGQKPVPTRIAEYVRMARRAMERLPVYKDPDPSGLGEDEMERVRIAVLTAAAA